MTASERDSIYKDIIKFLYEVKDKDYIDMENILCLSANDVYNYISTLKREKNLKQPGYVKKYYNINYLRTLKIRIEKLNNYLKNNKMPEISLNKLFASDTLVYKKDKLSRIMKNYNQQNSINYEKIQEIVYVSEVFDKIKGVNISTRKPRVCLRCRKTFISAGSYNRLCGKCNDTNKTISKIGQEMVNGHSFSMERYGLL